MESAALLPAVTTSTDHTADDGTEPAAESASGGGIKIEQLVFQNSSRN